MKKHLRHVCSFFRQRRMRAPRVQPAQALVELALSLTLLTMLLGAAADLGLAYKAHQTLTNAAAEASTYLSLRPADPTAAASDAEARKRFREEQGPTLRGLASTLDLDGDGQQDDMSVTASRVQIDVTDSGTINVGSNNFAVGAGSVLPISSGSNCGDRQRRFDSSGRQCFIVVRAMMIYKPFFIKPFVGSEMTITAISVKPIIESPL